jgi:hypothetical protein
LIDRDRAGGDQPKLGVQDRATDREDDPGDRDEKSFLPAFHDGCFSLRWSSWMTKAFNDDPWAFPVP